MAVRQKFDSCLLATVSILFDSLPANGDSCRKLITFAKKTSSLIRIQTFWHSDGIPERLFLKKLKLILKNLQTTKKKKNNKKKTKKKKKKKMPCKQFNMRD